MIKSIILEYDAENEEDRRPYYLTLDQAKQIYEDLKKIFGNTTSTWTWPSDYQAVPVGATNCRCVDMEGKDDYIDLSEEK